MADNGSHYQYVTASTMQWFLEPERGIFCSPGAWMGRQRYFSELVLSYQQEVEAVLKRGLSPALYRALVLVYRDGLTHGEAFTAVGIRSNRSDNLFTCLERKVGLLIEQNGLADVKACLQGGVIARVQPAVRVGRTEG